MVYDNELTRKDVNIKIIDGRDKGISEDMGKITCKLNIEFTLPNYVLPKFPEQ